MKWASLVNLSLVVTIASNSTLRASEVRLALAPRISLPVVSPIFSENAGNY
jgi:hypothetical protein